MYCSAGSFSSLRLRVSAVKLSQISSEFVFRRCVIRKDLREVLGAHVFERSPGKYVAEVGGDIEIAEFG